MTPEQAERASVLLESLKERKATLSFLNAAKDEYGTNAGELTFKSKDELFAYDGVIRDRDIYIKVNVDKEIVADILDRQIAIVEAQVADAEKELEGI